MKNCSWYISLMPKRMNLCSNHSAMMYDHSWFINLMRKRKGLSKPGFSIWKRCWFTSLLRYFLFCLPHCLLSLLISSFKYFVFKHPYCFIVLFRTLARIIFADLIFRFRLWLKNCSCYISLMWKRMNLCSNHSAMMYDHSWFINLMRKRKGLSKPGFST